MSYTVTKLLTLLAIFALTAEAVAAQSAQVRRELDQLSSPVAFERAAAVARLADFEGDIAGDLRVAYRFADWQERLSLFEVARLRNDAALVQAAAEALTETDEATLEHARHYLLTLPWNLLEVDHGELNTEQHQAWTGFKQLRMRRDIARVMLAAYILPGKYFGQFDDLLVFDRDALHRELIRLLLADIGFAAALNYASSELTGGMLPASRSLQNGVRRVQRASGAFEPVLLYLQQMRATPAVERGVARHTRASYLAAHEVFTGVRFTALRALGDLADHDILALELAAFYDILRKQRPSTDVAPAVNLNSLTVEVEVTLARCGDDALLQARIAAIRGQVERDQQLGVHVNMRLAARSDLTGMNEIAHLLLRAGDAEGAEAEWQAAVDTAALLMRTVDNRNRASLSSYLSAAYYNLACAQSLQSKISRGVASLKKAVEHGYRDFAWMLEDGDLVALRQVDEFKGWFSEVAPPSVVDRLPGR